MPRKNPIPDDKGVGTIRMETMVAAAVAAAATTMVTVEAVAAVEHAAVAVEHAAVAVAPVVAVAAVAND